MGKESHLSVYLQDNGQKEQSRFWGKVDMFLKIITYGSNWRGKIVGGLVTFLAMCYLIAPNPSILSNTRMPMGGVFLATTIFLIIAITKLRTIITRNRIAQQ